MDLTTETTFEIDRMVRAGFESRERIVEIFCEEIYAPGELDPAEVEQAVDAAISEQLHQQRSWPAVTDCDKLDSVFAALNCRRIIALQNAGFTQSDGYTDVQEALGIHPNPEDVLGYCFYHGQDLDRAVLNDGLYLAFGPIDGNQENTDGLLVGSAIVEEFNRAGFNDEGDGTFGPEDETYHDVAAICHFMRGVLVNPRNFLGLTDHLGETLQFFVEEDGRVTIEFIVKGEQGSMTKIASLGECMELVASAPAALAMLSIPGASFKQW